MSNDKENIEQEKKNKPSWWKKLLGLNPTYSLQAVKNIIIILIIILIILFVFAIKQKTEKVEIVYQNFIKKASNNKLFYVGKLKYSRTNYNAILINNSKILVIGDGKKNISKKAEIFDINKKQTVKVLNLKNSHSDDFLLKLPNNNILIIGKSIEEINIKTNTSKLVMLPDKSYKYTKGFAANIDNDSVLLLLGNTGTTDNDFTKKNLQEKKMFIYNLKNTNIVEIKNELDTKFSLFFEYTQNPLFSIGNDLFFIDCNYKILEKNMLSNCSINIYDKKHQSFNNYSIFPYNDTFLSLQKLNNEEIIIRTLSKITKYNLKNNEYTQISDISNVFYPTRFFLQYDNNKIIALGNLFPYSKNKNFERTQFLIDTEVNKILSYELINFSNYYDHSFKYGSSLNLNNNQIIYIGLLGGKNVYSTNK